MSEISTSKKFGRGQYRLYLMPGRFAVCRLGAGERVPDRPADEGFWSATAERGIWTLVCREEVVPETATAETGWRGLRVGGELPFDEVGVLADLSVALAAAAVSIYVVSTFGTDYLFVRAADLDQARSALEAAGCRVTEEAESASR